MATENAVPEKLTLDRSDGSATLELYRAALGPLHTDYYLKAFTRFDAAGKPGRSWNWSAALLTLNWLAFRRLWGPALAYTGATLAALLLLFGIVPLAFALAPAARWALLGLAVLLTVAVPGVFGNAWLYTRCNQAMARALQASATLEEACALLQQRAVGRPRLGGLAAANLALGAAVAAVVLSWPRGDALPLNTSKMERARAEASTPVTPITPLPSVVPSAAVAAARVASASPGTLASRTSQGRVQAAVPQADAPVSAPVSASVAAPVSPPVAAPVSAPVATAATAAASAAVATASAPLAAASVPKAARAALPARAPAASASSAAAGKYLVNVGLFADASNAQKAYTRLVEAGLPAQSQELSSAKGTRTRVRAGPFENRAEAEAAASKIRALKLDAAVFKP